MNNDIKDLKFAQLKFLQGDSNEFEEFIEETDKKIIKNKLILDMFIYDICNVVNKYEDELYKIIEIVKEVDEFRNKIEIKEDEYSHRCDLLIYNKLQSEKSNIYNELLDKIICEIVNEGHMETVCSAFIKDLLIDKAKKINESDIEYIVNYI